MIRSPRLLGSVRGLRGFLLRRRGVIAGAVLLSIILVIGLTLYLGYLAALPVPFIDELEDVASIRRLLVIAPHSDDEALAVAGLIHQVVERGGEVRVVVVTNGDGSFTGTMVEFRRLYPTTRHYLEAGARRQLESIAAMQALGVPEEHIIFLSYPDQGLRPLWERFWDDDLPYHSPYTRQDRSPYERTYNPAAVYSGHSLLTDVRSILRDFQPDTVVFPHPNDVHPDHWVAGAFTALAIAGMPEAKRPRMLLYLAHFGAFPLPRGHFPFLPLLPPLELVNATCTWGKVTLADESVDRKGDAIELYRSQLPIMGGYLRSFVRQNEIFCELDPPSVRRLPREHPITPAPGLWETADGSEAIPLFEDSARDTVPQQVGRGGDFVAVYAALWNNELWLSAEMRGSPSSLLTYSCLGRALDSGETSSMRVLHPPRARRRPPSEARDRFILIRFNLDELNTPPGAVVSCDVRVPRSRIIDRVGWVLLNFD